MNCPICDFSDVDHLVLDDAFEIRCRRCGNYRHTGSAEGTLQNLSDKDKTRLSTVIRNSNLRNRELFDFNTENIKKIIETYTDLSVSEKIDKLQINLSKLVNKPNDAIGISESLDWPLAYADEETEFVYYLDYLQENGLIRITNRGSGNFLLFITVSGWGSISELQKKIPSSNKAFVAMNFDKEFDNLYEQFIKIAIEDNGYKPIISKGEEYIDLIDDFIMAEIKESQFVVAEFTGQKHGVYFEAGYARGLGIPVIWVCKKDEIGDLHFDINHYNQIDWETPEELKKRLYNRIREVIYTY